MADPIEREELQQLSSGMRDLAGVLGRFDALTGRGGTSIQVAAGGAAVWMATTACVVMLGMMLVGGFWVTREFSTSDAERKELRRMMEDHNNGASVYRAEVQSQLEALRAKR